MIPYSLATSDVELDAQLTVIVAFFMFSQYDLVVFLLIEQFAYSDIKSNFNLTFTVPEDPERVKHCVVLKMFFE